MSRGPAPSRLCLLSDLPFAEIGEKVRFLGCVLSYSTASGCLELGHSYPTGSQVIVSVDIRLVLELINPELTRVGEWVNVLGYKIACKPETAATHHGSSERPVAEVQALRTWSTGPMDIARYEKQCAALPTG